MLLNRRVFIFAVVLFLAADWCYVNFFWKAPASQYSNFLGEKTVISGRVVSDPEQKGRDQQFVLAVDSYNETVLVTARSRNEFRYGDTVLLIGKLKAPQSSADFDYADYLWARGISSESYYPEIFIVRQNRGNYIYWTGLQVKHWLYQRLENIYDDKTFSILVAVVFGDKQYLDKSLTANFNNIGAAHMIAISGYKLTLLLILLDALVPYLGRKAVFGCSMLVAVFYLIAAGFALAVARSAVMSLLFSGAKFYGKKHDLLRSLLFTAVVLVILNPLIIKFDLGFILSFSGIFGIIVFSPVIEMLLSRLPFRIPEIFGLKEVFISTTAAQAATLPIIIYYFHTLSFISPAANLLLVPFLAPALLLAYFSAVPFLGLVFISLERAILVYMDATVNFLAGLKYAWVPVQINILWFLLIYLAEIILYLALKAKLNKLEHFAKMTAQKYDK